MSNAKSTQVAIVGAGPSGLLLSKLMHDHGIASIVLERQSREHVEARIRAGLLEWSTVELLNAAGVGARMMREGLVHGGFGLAFDGRMHRIDLEGLAGRPMLVYGQTEIERDLADATGDRVVWNAHEVAIHDFERSAPRVTYSAAGVQHELRCEFIAGCDGYHGVTRQSVPTDRITNYERIYPFGWLGILADVPPVSDELIYANHANGFALCSMRSRTRSRYYVQCALDDRIENWPDERFWAELKGRLPAAQASHVVEGPSIEKSIAPLRSFVAEPMRFGRLFLVGDAAHIVPPTGAKGLNLAAADVRVLHEGLIEYYRSNRTALLDEYSARALSRVWKATRFSWWFTTLMHKFSDDAFTRKLQIAELDYLADSPAASKALAENYTGLPFAPCAPSGYPPPPAGTAARPRRFATNTAAPRGAPDRARRASTPKARSMPVAIRAAMRRGSVLTRSSSTCRIEITTAPITLSTPVSTSSPANSLERRARTSSSFRRRFTGASASVAPEFRRQRTCALSGCSIAKRMNTHSARARRVAGSPTPSLAATTACSAWRRTLAPISRANPSLSEKWL